MSTTTIKPAEFEKAVIEALAKYGDKVRDVSQSSAKSVSRQATSELKGTSPSGSGQYARGWTHKITENTSAGYTETVYNRTRYMLVHLLEKPHRTGPKRGGHYPSKVDHTGIVAKVDDEYTNKFMEEVLSKL